MIWKMIKMYIDTHFPFFLHVVFMSVDLMSLLLLNNLKMLLMEKNVNILVTAHLLTAKKKLMSGPWNARASSPETCCVTHVGAARRLI